MEDKDAEDELPDATVRKILATVRPYEPARDRGPLGEPGAARVPGAAVT
ncbi:hypothetical protein SALBM135S_05257 [Streptomyces alboniger]